MLHAVIMAGGSGTRFWPVSRQRLPKQFLRIAGERSLIQMAYDRCQLLIPASQFWVVTNEQMVPTTAEHLPELPASHLIPEPCGRNTAPCVGLAAMLLSMDDPDATMLVMPADHVITPDVQFQAALKSAIRTIEEDPERLVLFGVPPDSPATGFGYIERGDQLDSGVYRVRSFREKPNIETAKEYIESGSFYWNCGIFVWKAATILRELKIHQPEISQLLNELRTSAFTPNWTEALRDLFPQMPSISIDYAVLEHSENIAVVEAPFQWDDVGSWEAMARLHPCDENGNTIIGNSAVVASQNCIVQSTTGHTVALAGVKDCIVVHTDDATLVANRNDESAVRMIVEHLRNMGRNDVL